MLTNFYPIHSVEELEKYLTPYLKLVLFSLEQYKINLNTANASGDHVGLQVLSSQEFDDCHQILLKNSKLIHDDIIHDRRNRIYRFHAAPHSSDITIPRIEIFEPKPGVDIRKLRAGIEHVAFTIGNYDEFLSRCQKSNIPIDKINNINGSKFFKTRFINGVEIEFRNDFLGEKK